MKNIVSAAIVWIVSHLILSLLCWAIYIALIEHSTNLRLSYVNWVGIVIICTLVFPKEKNIVNEFKDKAKRGK